MSGRPDEQVIIITGMSRGLGLQTATALINDGYKLALFNRTPVSDPILLSHLHSNPERVREWRVDVTDQRAVAEAVAEVMAEWGRVDALINNAGAKLYTAFENISPEEFDQVIKTNINGPYYLCREVIPIMKQQGYGKIINMASRSGMEFYARGTAYCASKAGLIGFSQSLAEELRGTGITVNVLCPSAVATDEYRQEQPRADLHRMTQVEEISDVIRSLLCCENRHTGMIWPFYDVRSFLKALLKTGIQFIRWIPQLRIRVRHHV